VRVLLVDDSKTILKENESALCKAGYTVLCAEDGDTALKLARERNPDVVILDLMLPGMGGLEVLQNLKREPTTAEIPVIIVSGLTQKNKQKLLDEGAADYLEKNSLMPVRGINHLPKAVENVMSRARRRKGVGVEEI
jgi:DNA-binding response OmpR family regulator